jgi:hypothetical protein
MILEFLPEASDELYAAAEFGKSQLNASLSCSTVLPCKQPSI